MAGPVPLPNLNLTEANDLGPTVQTGGAKTLSFAGPTIYRGAPGWFYIAALAVAGFGGLYLLKGR